MINYGCSNFVNEVNKNFVDIFTNKFIIDILGFDLSLFADKLF